MPSAPAPVPAPDVPPDDYFSMLGFFTDVIDSMPNRRDRAEEIRKYLFEAQALSESFPNAWLDDVKDYKEDSIDSKSEGIKTLLHNLYREFQLVTHNNNNNSNNNSNDGNTNNESLGPSWPPRAGAAAYNNNNTINNNSYSTNSEVNMRMRLPPGFGRRRRSTRKTKGGKRRRRNTRK